MAFPLSRGAKGMVVTEVQRWQYFLRRQGSDQVGNIDGDFGLNTELATKFFQVKAGLTPSGRLDDKTLTKVGQMGYTVLPDGHYAALAQAGLPPKPKNLDTPTSQSRTKNFGCFNFFQHPLAERPDEEAIVIKGGCAAGEKDWTAANIVTFDLPQMRFAVGYHGKFRCHEAAKPVFEKLFAEWEAADLLHLVISYSGCFVPRYMREKAPPGDKGHGLKESSKVATLSNHSFGSAFDINVAQNGWKKPAAAVGRKGCVRELVEIANLNKVYWGGHFYSEDGMHFEISDL